MPYHVYIVEPSTLLDSLLEDSLCLFHNRCAIIQRVFHAQWLTTLGEKIVRIIASCKTGRKIPIPPPARPGTMIDERIQCIPKQYNEQSTLRVQITPGKDNTHNFDLKPATATR